MSTEYTKEQHDAVKRILSLKETAYYEILIVEKSSTSVEIKRAYKKLALKMHPDKNKAPKSDEAFKKLSKAFQVLGDDDKRRIFDQTGADPDSRSAAGPGFGGFGNAGRSAQAYNRQPFASPDDFMNMFFGGPGGGTFASAGPGFQFHFGGGDDLFSTLFRQANVNSHTRPRQETPEEKKARADNDKRMKWIAFLVLFVLLLPNIFGWFFPSTDSNLPNFSFQKSNYFDQLHKTPKYKIPFYVNSNKMSSVSSSKEKTMGRKVENQYISEKRQACNYEYEERQREMQRARGFFRTDYDRYNRAKNARLPNCEILENLGLSAFNFV